nr:hypothetical protein [Tanacetum cinerariifolium]
KRTTHAFALFVAVLVVISLFQRDALLMSACNHVGSGEGGGGFVGGSGSGGDGLEKKERCCTWWREKRVEDEQ